RPGDVVLARELDGVEPVHRVGDAARADLEPGLAQHAAERDDVPYNGVRDDRHPVLARPDARPDSPGPLPTGLPPACGGRQSGRPLHAVAPPPRPPASAAARRRAPDGQSAPRAGEPGLPAIYRARADATSPASASSRTDNRSSW